MIFEEPEGATPLDPDEIDGLKFSHVSTRGELDELEQAKITQGLQWLGRRRGGDILSDDFVRLLHKRLFGEVWDWAGTYRLREKNIGIEAKPNTISLSFGSTGPDLRWRHARLQAQQGRSILQEYALFDLDDQVMMEGALRIWMECSDQGVEPVDAVYGYGW